MRCVLACAGDGGHRGLGDGAPQVVHDNVDVHCCFGETGADGVVVGVERGGVVGVEGGEFAEGVGVAARGGDGARAEEACELDGQLSAVAGGPRTRTFSTRCSTGTATCSAMLPFGGVSPPKKTRRPSSVRPTPSKPGTSGRTRVLV